MCIRDSQWSGQLVFAAFNLGNVKRNPHIPNRAGNWNGAIDKSMIIELVFKCPAHIFTMSEASGIQDDDVRHRLRGWSIVQSFSGELAVGVRTNGTAVPTILFDSTNPNQVGGRDYEDDPTDPLEDEKFLWYMIVEAEFGTIEVADLRDHNDPRPTNVVRSSGKVRRSSLERARVLVFQINNTMARERCSSTRLRLRQMFLDAARYQVDFMGGDANSAIYRYFKKQSVMSIAKSSFSIMLQTLVHSINQVIQDPAQKVHAGVVTSNSWEFFEKYSNIVNNHSSEEAYRLLNAEDLSIDCVVGVVLSWGHSNPVSYTHLTLPTILRV